MWQPVTLQWLSCNLLTDGQRYWDGVDIWINATSCVGSIHQEHHLCITLLINTAALLWALALTWSSPGSIIYKATKPWACLLTGTSKLLVHIGHTGCPVGQTFLKKVHAQSIQVAKTCNSADKIYNERTSGFQTAISRWESCSVQCECMWNARIWNYPFHKGLLFSSLKGCCALSSHNAVTHWGLTGSKSPMLSFVTCASSSCQTMRRRLKSSSVMTAQPTVMSTLGSHSWGDFSLLFSADLPSAACLKGRPLCISNNYKCIIDWGEKNVWGFILYAVPSKCRTCKRGPFSAEKLASLWLTAAGGSGSPDWRAGAQRSPWCAGPGSQCWQPPSQQCSWWSWSLHALGPHQKAPASKVLISLPLRELFPFQTLPWHQEIGDWRAKHARRQALCKNVYREKSAYLFPSSFKACTSSLRQEGVSGHLPKYHFVKSHPWNQILNLHWTLTRAAAHIF